jgi:hypothetical protein
VGTSKVVLVALAAEVEGEVETEVELPLGA